MSTAAGRAVAAAIMTESMIVTCQTAAMKAGAAVTSLESAIRSLKAGDPGTGALLDAAEYTARALTDLGRARAIRDMVDAMTPKEDK